MRVGKALAPLGVSLCVLLASACSGSKESTGGSAASPSAGATPSPSPSREPREPRTTRFPRGWSEIQAPPDQRTGPASGWTGNDLLLWGGYIFHGSMGDESVLSDGYSFDPRSGKVSGFAKSPLEARQFPASAWTGEELLVWGGWNGGAFKDGSFFDDGAAYDPATDTWRELPAAPLSARSPHAVWTGEEFIVWGTQLRTKELPVDGASYDPAADRWSPIAEAPFALTDADAVWTGDEMAVVGASLQGGNRPLTRTAVGLSYDPRTDEWTELPRTALSPQASATAMSGDLVVAWDYGSLSQVFDPRSEKWGPTLKVPVDDGECGPEAVSVGDAIIGNYCGFILAFENGAWRKEPPPGFAKPWEKRTYYRVVIAGAGDAALVFASPDRGSREAMAWSYRP